MKNLLASILLGILFPLAAYSAWQGMNISNNTLYSVKFMQGNQIGFVTEVGRIYRTYDYGTNWGSVIVDSNNTDLTFHDIAILDTNHLIVVGTNGSIYRTTNGTNWIASTIQTAETNLSVDFIDDQNGLVSATGGKIYYTNNSGNSWQQAVVPVGTTKYNDLDFITSTNAVAVGNSGAVLKSTDGGKNWTKINLSITDNLRSVNFPTSNTGYACGANGRIMKTTDAGTNWTTLNKFTNADLNSLYFVNDANGMVVGDNGVVLSTINGGQTWTAMNTSTSSNLQYVSYSAPDYVYIVGNSGSAVRTDNNGAGTEMQLSLIAPNSDTTYTSDKNAIISWSGMNMENQNIQILYSSNNGSTWNNIATVNYNDSTYQWDVPDLASTQMRIQIRHALNFGVNDVSDNAFAVTTNKVNITSPNISSRFQSAKTVAITWNSFDLDFIDLEYTLDGSTWLAIADNVPAGSGLYYWDAPLTAANTYQVRATDASNSLNTSTSPAFTIANLALQNPQEGSIVNNEFTYPVTWSSNLIDNVKLEYSTDSTNWFNITTMAAANGTYNWNTPDNVSGKSWLRLSDAQYPTIKDIHSFIFAATEVVSVTQPNTQSAFLLGQNVEIKWSSAITQNVKIEVSYDNGTNWESLINMISASVGTFNWIPSQLSSNALVRVSSTADPSVYDISDQPIKISDISILAPGAGQELQAETSTAINWSSTNIDNVKIEYSLNNWTNKTEIVNSISAQTGTYAWNVPDFQTNNARVKISDVNFPNVAREVVFNIKQTLNLSLTAPHGGELLKSGNQYPITWKSKNVASIDIDYSTDGGTNWLSVATMIDATKSPYYWTVPDLNSQTCLVKVYQSTDPSIFAESDSSFIISNARLELLSPNGGELWYINDTKEIKWDSKGINNLGLAYRLHKDSAWIDISNSEPASPSMKYNWTLPIIPSNNVSIKVYDTENPGIYDVSDAVFTVAGVKLTSLNSGEKLIFREETVVTWEAVEVTDVQLSYSIDNGNNWNIIENSFSAEKESYTWDAPYPPSDSCLFRIRDNNNSSLVDTSDITFSINGLLLLNDMNGKELLVGTDYNIDWLSQDVDNVKIEYSTDRGNNWLTIISYTESDGKYKWLVPNTPAEYCKLKVTDLDNSTVYDQNIGNFKITGTGINLITPNGNETWALGSIDTIKWSSVNVDFINIDISYDNGITPVRIASSIPADTNYNQFIWTVVGSPSTECQITISDADNYNLKATSESNFTITGGVFPPPQHWTYQSHTGKNSVIILPASVHPEVSGRPFSAGDAMGVFYTDLSGNEKSAGYGIWDGNNLSVTVWGDNDQTTAKDGFTIEETYKLRLWDAQDGKETRAKVTYASGNSFFTDNGISIIGSMNAHQKLRIILEPGVWSMISSYLLPANTNIDTVMKEVKSLELMKDELGDLYYPDQEINTINNWDVTDGYQIYVNEKDTLEIEGTLVNAANYPIAMESSKWYIISYLFDAPIPITTAMSRIDSSIVLVKNDDGEIWYPAYGINQIGSMQPTEGYKIVLNENNTLVYNSGGLVPKIKAEDAIVAEKYEVEHKQTGSNCNLILSLLDFEYGDEVAIKNSYGLVVGSGINENGKVAITIWGDDPNTENIDGMQHNEQLNIYLWSADQKVEYKLEIDEYKDVLAAKVISGTITYKTDAIYEAKASKANITSVNDKSDNEVRIYPNPTSEYLQINTNLYSKYSVCNMLGNTVLSGNLESAKIDVSKLSVGAYTIRLSTSEKSEVFKFTIVR